MKIISSFLLIAVVLSDFASSQNDRIEPMEGTKNPHIIPGIQTLNLTAAARKFNQYKYLLAEKLTWDYFIFFEILFWSILYYLKRIVKLEAATQELVAGMSYKFNGTYNEVADNQTTHLIWASVWLYEVEWNPSANQMKIVYQRPIESNQEN